MNSPSQLTASFGIVTGICVALCAPAGAQIFSEDFDSITAPPGNFNGAPDGQVTTTHDLVFGASLTGWSNGGAGSVHAVDTGNTWTGGSVSANPQNWGVMFWQDNVITLNTAIPGSNDNGTKYRIDFLAAGGVYEAPGQVNNGTSDGIQIEVLRASDSAVLHTFTHMPASPVGVGDLGLAPVNFDYTGDGSGDILFRIGPSNPNQGRFGGTIDDLELSVADPDTPSIASFTATPNVLANPGEAVTFEWSVGGLPLDSLVVTPGDIDVLGDTDGAGAGSRTLDPGPNVETTYTLTAVRGGGNVSREVVVSILPPPGNALFSEDFEGISAPPGNFNGAPAGQVTTTHDLVFGASLSGWSNAGAGSVHAVDTGNTWTGGSVSANPQNWGVMFWQDNVITLNTAIPGSNDGGAEYSIDFLAAGGVYEAASQVNNGTSDGIQIEVLRASDSAVLHTFTHTPAPPVGVDDLGLAPVNFTYTGDGSGEILFRIGPSNPNQGRFGGTIDDLELSVVDPLGPKILSFTADPAVLADVADPVTLDWEVELPLDSLVLTPGDVDVLPHTDGAGVGSLLIDPGPDGTTEYSLTATRGGESLSRFVTVTLPAPEIISFTASPSPLAGGEPITLSWEIGLPASTLTITPGDLDVLGDTDGTGAGSITLDPGPSETTAYTLTATLGTSASNTTAVARVLTPPNPDSIFFDDFSEFTTAPQNFNGGQFQSGLDLAHSGVLPGWVGSGQNDVHVVDLANTTGNIVNPRDFAVMIWQDNVITQLNPIAGANNAGTEYLVQFDAGPAVYQAGSQQTGPTDGLLIELLRDDDSVLAEFVFEPGAWAGFPTLVPGSFQYTGDGSGDLRLRVGPSAFGSGRFGGTIDNLTVAPLTSPRVRITDLSHNAAAGELSISWESADGKLYNLRSETDPSSAEPIDWPVFGGHSDMAATPPENTLTIPLPPEAERYFVIEEFNAPPVSILADDFEAGQGQWTAGSDGAGGTVWELGAPGAPGPAAAKSGANCFGTNLTSAYAIDAEVWLRSPEINLTNAGGATLSYSQFFDIEENFDLGQVAVLDASSGSVLVLLESGLDGTSPDWEQVTKVLPAEALGKVIQIEFRLFTDDFDSAAFAGWYLDDFDLTIP